MTHALRLKADAQGLSRSEATALINDAVRGDDWQFGYTFPDGSSINVRFSPDSDDVERCNIDWWDEQGKRPKPAVRTRLTCSFLDTNESIEAYYDGSILFDHALPYLTATDVDSLIRKVRDVRIVGGHARHRYCITGSEQVFEILPPGYEWGEHKTAFPFLLDLGPRVIEVYAISGPDWEWVPFYTNSEDSPVA